MSENQNKFHETNLGSPEENTINVLNKQTEVNLGIGSLGERQTSYLEKKSSISEELQEKTADVSPITAPYEDSAFINCLDQAEKKMAALLDFLIIPAGFIIPFMGYHFSEQLLAIPTINANRVGFADFMFSITLMFPVYSIYLIFKKIIKKNKSNENYNPMVVDFLRIIFGFLVPIIASVIRNNFLHPLTASAQYIFFTNYIYIFAYGCPVYSIYLIIKKVMKNTSTTKDS